jgi:hypothetical protein
MDSEDSLDAFIESVDWAIEQNAEVEENSQINKAPRIDTGIFCRFPVLMKNNPHERENPKSPDCKKCQMTKKRLEEKIEKLESTILFQQDQLFELYSHLKARVTALEQKSPQSKNGSI